MLKNSSVNGYSCKLILVKILYEKVKRQVRGNTSGGKKRFYTYYLEKRRGETAANHPPQGSGPCTGNFFLLLTWSQIFSIWRGASLVLRKGSSFPQCGLGADIGRRTERARHAGRKWRAFTPRARTRKCKPSYSVLAAPPVGESLKFTQIQCCDLGISNRNGPFVLWLYGNL